MPQLFYSYPVIFLEAFTHEMLHDHIFEPETLMTDNKFVRSSDPIHLRVLNQLMIQSSELSSQQNPQFLRKLP